MPGTQRTNGPSRRPPRATIHAACPGACQWGYNAVMSDATSVTVTVGVRELKNQLSSYLDRVKAGEEVTVTEHGRPIARLTSVAPDVDRMAALVAAGIVRPAQAARRRLPSKRAKLDAGEPLAELVGQQRR